MDARAGGASESCGRAVSRLAVSCLAVCGALGLSPCAPASPGVARRPADAPSCAGRLGPDAVAANASAIGSTLQRRDSAPRVSRRVSRQARVEPARAVGVAVPLSTDQRVALALARLRTP